MWTRSFIAPESCILGSMPLARTPYKPVLVQERKRIYSSASEEEFKDQIALFASEFMRDGSAYILGAGTTTSRIAELLGVEKTLLGVDVIQNGKLIMKDASEKRSSRTAGQRKAGQDHCKPNWCTRLHLGQGQPADQLHRAETSRCREFDHSLYAPQAG